MNTPTEPTFGVDPDGTYPVEVTYRVRVTDANALLFNSMQTGNDNANPPTTITHVVAVALSKSAQFLPEGIVLENVRVELDGKTVETRVSGTEA